MIFNLDSLEKKINKDINKLLSKNEVELLKNEIEILKTSLNTVENENKYFNQENIAKIAITLFAFLNLF